MVMKGRAFNVTTTYGFELMGTDTEKYGSFASRRSFLFTLPRKICIRLCGFYLCYVLVLDVEANHILTHCYEHLRHFYMKQYAEVTTRWCEL